LRELLLNATNHGYVERAQATCDGVMDKDEGMNIDILGSGASNA
jgi:hypothetical protein